MHPADIDLERRSIIPLGHPVLPMGRGRPAPNSLAEAALSASRLPPGVARRAQNDLDRLELAESFHRSARATKKGLMMVAGGFALAVFPFAANLPGVCAPSHNPGWLCGARITSIVCATEAAITGIVTGIALWRERGVIAQRAAAMGTALQRDAVHNGGEVPGPNFFDTFLAASAAGRLRLRENIEDAITRV